MKFKKYILLISLFILTSCRAATLKNNSYFQLINSENKLMHRIEDAQTIIDLFALFESSEIQEQGICSDYYIWLKYMKNEQVEVSYRINLFVNREKDSLSDVYLMYIENTITGKILTFNNVDQAEELEQFFDFIEFDAVAYYYENY